MFSFNQNVRNEYALEYQNEYDGMKSEVLFSKHLNSVIKIMLTISLMTLYSIKVYQ